MSYGLRTKDNFGVVTFQASSDKLTRLIHERVVYGANSGSHYLGKMPTSKHPMVMCTPLGVADGELYPGLLSAWLTRSTNGEYRVHWGEMAHVTGSNVINKNLQHRRSKQVNEGSLIRVIAYA